MLGRQTIRIWYLVHKWTSLISTAFLLLLCVTGLPLIFHEEISHWLDEHPEAENLPADTPMANVDHIIDKALANRPGEVMMFVAYEPDAPIVHISTGPSPSASPEQTHTQAFDARTAQLIEAPAFDETFMYLFYKLHVDMFAGLPGTLFLGAMGLLFVVAIISGLVIYGPFMRKLEFGTVRTRKSTRLKWLDLHNLLGVVTLAWALVVGLTGVVNTLATPILGIWQADQMAEMTAPYQGMEPAKSFSSTAAAIETASQAAPDMTPSILAYPQTIFSSDNHFAVFMHGDTPLTSRLLYPVLIDAETGELTDARSMPWYVTALFVSQPLHFGDYGGMPMKILWAVLDVITIIVLASGLYLWLNRRRTPLAERERLILGELS